MPRPLSALLLFAIGAAVAACCTKPASQEQPKTEPQPQTQPQPKAQSSRYPLTRGSSIGIRTGTDGASTIAVTIPPGSQGAGEYVSTAEALVEPAREAKNALNEPGRTTVIDVDADGRLVAIETTAQVPVK